MKSTALLITGLTPLALSVPLEKRQFSLGAIINSLPPSYVLHPLVTQTTTPNVRKTATRKLIRYGPFKLAANTGGKTKDAGHNHGSMGGMADILDILLGKTSMDPAGFTTMRVLPDSMCRDCTVLAGKVDAVFENGTQASFDHGVYLHHAITIDLDKKAPNYIASPKCSGPDLNLLASMSNFTPFVAGGVDNFTQLFTTPDGKFNSGFYLGDDSKFMLQAELVNYLPTEQTVYLQVDMEYVNGRVGGDVIGSGLAAPACTMTTGWRPEKNTSGKVEGDGYRVVKDGYIISARAHLHDGGTSVSLFHNNKLYCTSNAIYGGKSGVLTVDGKKVETISKLTECNEPLKIKVGDILKVEAAFDTGKHPLRESQGKSQEAMAIMGLMFAESKAGL